MILSDAIAQFLSSPKVVSAENRPIALCIEIADEHLIGGSGDRIYVRRSKSGLGVYNVSRGQAVCQPRPRKFWAMRRNMSPVGRIQTIRGTCITNPCFTPRRCLMCQEGRGAGISGRERLRQICASWGVSRIGMTRGEINAGMAWKGTRWIFIERARVTTGINPKGARSQVAGRIGRELLVFRPFERVVMRCRRHPRSIFSTRYKPLRFGSASRRGFLLESYFSQFLTKSLHPHLKYWLALARIPGVGPLAVQRLLAHFSVEHVFQASPDSLRGCGFSDKLIEALKNPPWDKVALDLQWLSQPENHALTLEDADYPEQLKEIADPPPLLFIKGNKDLLRRPQIAMVGSRNPSNLGVKTALEFAQALSEAGFVVTSGMALGIDAASHQGALNVGGFTVAVAGTGLDRVYPACHKQLQELPRRAHWFQFRRGPRPRPVIFAAQPHHQRVVPGLIVVEAAQQAVR